MSGCQHSARASNPPRRRQRRAPHNLHVLLRHRLLRQPGIEGLFFCLILAAFDAHAVANSPDPCTRVLDSGTAGAPPRMDPSDDHDALARVDVLVNLGLPLIEGVDPVRGVFPITLSTAVDGLSLRLVLGRESSRSGWINSSTPSQSRVEPLCQRADDLDVLLRHRPLSISPGGGSALGTRGSGDRPATTRAQT